MLKFSVSVLKSHGWFCVSSSMFPHHLCPRSQYRGGFNEDPGAKFCLLHILLAPTFPILRNWGGWSPLAEIKAETWNFVSSQAFIPKGRNKGLIPLSPFLHLFYCKWEMVLKTRILTAQTSIFRQLKALFREVFKDFGNVEGVAVYRSSMGNVLSSWDFGEIFIILI